MFINQYKVDGNITTIYYTNKKKKYFEVLIDTEDLEKLKKLNYAVVCRYVKESKRYYAFISEYIPNSNVPKIHRLHRLIMNYPEGYDVDHINHNPLDNRKENLRIVKRGDNDKNRKGANCNNKTTGVRNVHLITGYKGKQKLLVQIMKNGIRHAWEFPLNQFDEACIFAKKKRKELFGEYAGNG